MGRSELVEEPCRYASDPARSTDPASSKQLSAPHTKLSVRTESIRSSVVIRTPVVGGARPSGRSSPGSGRSERRVLVGIMPGIP
jgi:hypothetical protein